MEYWFFSSPLGELALVSGEKGIKRLLLPGWNREKMIDYLTDLYPEIKPGKSPAPAIVKQAKKYLERYFQAQPLPELPPLDFSELSRFKKKVYEQTMKIPWGETRTYSWLAEKIKNPRATRAVAQALARNPLPIFIPCHRVVGKDRSLRGFSAPGGIKLKIYLLRLEKAL